MKRGAKLVDPVATGIEFIRSELETGLTFTRIAHVADRGAKVTRNRANARKAYDAVLRFAPRVPQTAAESKAIEVKLEKLKAQLRELGEEL